MIDEEGKKKVITFVGTTPNIGTTLIALTTAVRIAEQSGKKIAFLCLNLKSSKLHRYVGVGDERASLDELLPQLRNGSLDPQRLQHAMHRYSNGLDLHILFGNRYRETAEFYGVEELTDLINIASQVYDYVLLDVNAYWDNAGTISALLEAQQIAVVTTNALTHFQEDYLAWLGAMGEHMQLETKQMHVAVVKQHPGMFQPRQCYLQLGGTALPAASMPNSLYEALDRGELRQWHLRDKEGRKWLSAYAGAFAVTINTKASSVLGFRRKGMLSTATTMLFKQN